MKYQPYREIINIEIELKEYRKLCRGKSEKYLYYSDWKTHIQELFSNFQSNDKIENFKHFLLNRHRISSTFSADYIPIIILYFTFKLSFPPVPVNFSKLILYSLGSHLFLSLT